MAYCSRCGQMVGEADAFCGHCAARQPVEPPRSPGFGSGLSPRAAKMLCYVPLFGWIAALVVLATDRFRENRDVRFHAFQGLYLFLGWLLVDKVIGPFFSGLPHHGYRVEGLLQAAMLGVWIFMLVKTSNEESYALPIIGELAEKSTTDR